MQAVIVGAGASGVLHALALRAAGVRIAAVYDPDLQRARDLADACGARIVESLAAAASVDAEIAAVCSPPSAHLAQATLLSSLGRTVFVEKPVATTRAELSSMLALSRCVPILQWRAGRALRALRRAIVHGELGPSPTVSCDLAWGRDDAYFLARAGWGCGALLSVGIHAIDAIAWALGQRIEGAAGLMARSRAVTSESESSAVLLLRFSGGAIASLRISLDGGADVTRITMCGDGKSVQLQGGEADPTGSVLRWFGARGDQERLEALERDTPGALGSPLLVPYVGGAIRGLRDGERPGETERLPSIASTYGAHAAAMRVTEDRVDGARYAVPSDVEDARPPFRCATSACAAASRAIVTRNGEHET